MSDFHKLLKKINGDSRLSTLMKVCCYLVTALSVAVFVFLMYHAFCRSLTEGIGYAMTLAIPFLAVSIVRRLINAPRPYELYDFFDTPPKKTKGESFPSRHAFSIFAIGTLCLFVQPLLGGITLLLGALMCVCRVLLGMHFVRDVLCGALVGIISSVIGALILI